MAFEDEFVKFKSPHTIMKEALLAEIERLLPECTPEQRENFKTRIYPKGIDINSSQVQVMQAVDIIHRTVAKNRAARPVRLVSG